MAITSAPTIAKIKVHAIGRNIFPSIPSSVRIGRKTIMIIPIPNRMGRMTSLPDSDIL